MQFIVKTQPEELLRAQSALLHHVQRDIAYAILRPVSQVPPGAAHPS